MSEIRSELLELTKEQLADLVIASDNIIIKKNREIKFLKDDVMRLEYDLEIDKKGAEISEEIDCEINR